MRVKFQTAVALREAGFNGITDAYYALMLDRNPLTYTEATIDWNRYKDIISAPTTAEALDYIISNGHYVAVLPSTEAWFFSVRKLGNLRMVQQSEGYFDTYHEALEEGIIHALNQIK